MINYSVFSFNLFLSKYCIQVVWYFNFISFTSPHAKKVVSDSPGLVNFALSLPNGQVKVFKNSNYRRTV